MGCLECGSLDIHHPAQWLCVKCETRWITLGEKYVHMIEDVKRKKDKK